MPLLILRDILVNTWTESNKVAAFLTTKTHCFDRTENITGKYIVWPQMTFYNDEIAKSSRTIRIECPRLFVGLVHKSPRISIKLDVPIRLWSSLQTYSWQTVWRWKKIITKIYSPLNLSLLTIYSIVKVLTITR